MNSKIGEKYAENGGVEWIQNGRNFGKKLQDGMICCEDREKTTTYSMWRADTHNILKTHEDAPGAAISMQGICRYGQIVDSVKSDVMGVTQMTIMLDNILAVIMPSCVNNHYADYANIV